MNNQSLDLRSIGWTDERTEELQERFSDALPARISAQHLGAYDLLTEIGPMTGQVSGRLRHISRSPSELPAVGDWVAIRTTDATSVVIEGVLERKSTLSRKVAGVVTDEQIIGANIDVLFVVCALDDDLNLRRIERYLSVAWQSGALPTIVLTKSDLCDDVVEIQAAVEKIAPETDVFVVSDKDPSSVAALYESIQPGTTLGLVGSSGVGKSTLLNLFAGQEVMPTGDLRRDGKGRHTTSHRQLIPLPHGVTVIDTPGMREIQLWDVSGGISTAFEDIEALAAGCRFSDCSHLHEPGCAVKEAVKDGTLPHARLESYEKQIRELASLEARRDKRLAGENARRGGKVGKEAKEAKNRARHQQP